MKTVIIYEEVTEPIKFFVVERDCTHLDRVYINSTRNQKKVDELSALMYGKENSPEWKDGQIILYEEKEFPYQEVKDGAKVIVAGFLP